MATKTKKVNKKSNSVIKVMTITPKGKKATRDYHYTISSYGSLGREIKISPKANITVNEPGFKTEFFVESVNVLIGIGNDHTADLIMSKDSWEALKKGAEISITTTKDFKKKIFSK